MTVSLRRVWAALTRRLSFDEESGPERRWVVVDVETTGLDPSRDSLLAIGAVGLGPAGIDLADSFEVIVRQPFTSSRDNIVVHRIGAQAQAGGEDAAIARARFLEFVGDAVIVGFHVSFDRAFLARELGRLGASVPSRWLDLAELAPVLLPGHRTDALDDWLARVGVPVGSRHRAASDALATAMLFQYLLAKVRPAEHCFRGLSRLAKQARWLGAG